MRVSDVEVPPAMRSVYRRLQRWRRKRKGRAAIPEALWMTAGQLARKHGINPVSRVLGLEFNRLRKMAETASRSRSKGAKPAAFVELVPPEAIPPQCAMELEGQHARAKRRLR